MKARLLALSRILSRVSLVVMWLAGFGLVAMTSVVAYQVFMRFVINSSPAWTEAGAIMIMSWFIFLGAAVGVREKFHMGFDVLLYVLPDSALPWLRSISDIFIFIFAAGMVVYGSELAIRFWSTQIPVVGLSTAFTYFPIIVSGALMCLFIIERMALRLAGEPVDGASVASEITEV